ncbi:WPP domain-associated protein [Humulus lupulus]|uniref:WPP domain-associated protein n=1 Tax=Humulus lupulus TaxID=3486 RepID=UPI002B414A98|nr:WPP domain-associated protein [Humulus lupulus]XP_062095977.1 WPP domain-associated protein [Humulus lupulus]
MIMENLEVVDSGVEPCFNDSMQTSDDFKDSENLGVDILADLDSYWQDINDRLTLSRMVSDSVIKGMVTAVTQEAAEKIFQKEQEIAELKEMLNAYRVGMDEEETVGSLAREHESKVKVHCCFDEAITEHDRMKDNLGSLRNTGREQFAKLKKEINQLRGCNSIKRKSSSSELLGLGGILHENSSEKWCDVDKTLDSLNNTLETICKGVEDIVHLSKGSLHEWKLEQEFQAEIEALVMGNCIHSLEREFEEKLWDRISGDKGISWFGRVKEISCLREELGIISKALCISEAGHLISHGSFDSEGWCNGKVNDHFHHKVPSNHVTPSSSLSEENGKHNDSQAKKLENSDLSRLKHMSNVELISYYNNEMTKMKRNHESKVQEMTEDYFTLKREYLRDKGSLLSKKDKEFDMLRKKIPEVILKLDDIIAENEKLPTFTSNAETLGGLKERMEMLLAENRQLRDFLAEKKKEVKGLSRQVSDGAERMSHHSLSETKLLNTIRSLKSSIEDLRIEGSIGADVFTCLLKEMVGQMNCMAEESFLEYSVMQELYESIIKEVSDAQITSRCKIQDSDMLPIIMLGLTEAIYRESWKEAKDKLSMLDMQYINENEARVSLEKEIFEKGKTLEIEVAEKERLEQEIVYHVEEKMKLAQDAAAALQIEKEQFQLVTEEVECLRLQICEQQTLISKSSTESDVMKSDLAAALKDIELYKKNIFELNKDLERIAKELIEADKERKILLTVTQEKQNAVSLHERNERVVRKQMEAMAILVKGLSKAATDFECQVTKGLSKHDLRLKSVSSQSRLLIQKANILRRTGVLYKQRLDRRCSDLQKAEAEVDALGDEVDTLLGLLEKIYIALDHYSPILQHYPGIIEILKLVKTELSGGESTRPV